MLLTSTKNTTETAKKEFELNKKKNNYILPQWLLVTRSRYQQIFAGLLKESKKLKYNNKIIVKNNDYEAVEINALPFTYIDKI